MTQWKMKEGNTSVNKLRQSIKEHSSGLTALKVDPTYDPLRREPRFQALVQHIGLAQ
jgi:hypothetical protein